MASTRATADAACSTSFAAGTPTRRAQTQAYGAETVTPKLAELAPQLSRDFAGAIFTGTRCIAIRCASCSPPAPGDGNGSRHPQRRGGPRRSAADGDRVSCGRPAATSRRTRSSWPPACGAPSWRDVGARLPIEGGKGYHVELEARGGDPELPIWLHESRVVITPLGGRVRLAGTLELTGTDRRVDARRVRAITAPSAVRCRHSRARSATHVWRGLRRARPTGCRSSAGIPNLDNAILAGGPRYVGSSTRAAHGSAGRVAGRRRRA